jgi:3'-5' exoribonuclease
METQKPLPLRLADLAVGQQADLFVLLSAKQEQTARNGSRYIRVGFCDATRELSFPIWDNSPHAADCRNNWQVGQFYKIRASYQENQYGAQLDIDRIRAVTDADAADGFDPKICIPASRFDPEEMIVELIEIIEQRIADQPLRELVLGLLDEHRERFMSSPAARTNHHAYRGGLLEHVLSVTKTCLLLAEKYDAYYLDLNPPLDKDVVIAGAVLHDIGKLREYRLEAGAAEYSPAGNLIGHILLGRDMIREHPAAADLDPERLLRLEHVIVAHQRLPEWGSPKPPMTPEALIVHYADDLDAKYAMMASALGEAAGEADMTSSRNPLRQRIYRGNKPR